MSPAAYLKAASEAPAQFCAKIAFPSRAMARLQMKKKKGWVNHEVATSVLSGPLFVYRCEVCRQFHLTHNKKGGNR